MDLVLQWQRFREGRCIGLRTYPVCITVCGQAILSEIFMVLRVLNFEIIHWNRLRSYMLLDSLFTPILLCYFPVLLASWTVDASCKMMSPIKRSTQYATLLSSLSLIVNRNYRGAHKSLARPTSRCILFEGESISFDASLVIYIVLIFLQLW
jgi:hypothetical protein